MIVGTVVLPLALASSLSLAIGATVGSPGLLFPSLLTALVSITRIHFLTIIPKSINVGEYPLGTPLSGYAAGSARAIVPRNKKFENLKEYYMLSL